MNAIRIGMLGLFIAGFITCEAVLLLKGDRGQALRMLLFLPFIVTSVVSVARGRSFGCRPWYRVRRAE